MALVLIAAWIDWISLGLFVGKTDDELMKQQGSRKTIRASVMMVFFFSVGCASVAEKRPESGSPKSSEPSTAPLLLTEDEASQIDIFGLQKELGLERETERLGFSERKFNTCEVGYGFSRSRDCQSKYFVVIHFQLLCRDSEGTVSTTLQASDLTALSQRPVSWILKPSSGKTDTDASGYGQIRMISAASAKRQRLKLAVGNDFLYMRANEITQVVTPQPWCNP